MAVVMKTRYIVLRGGLRDGNWHRRRDPEAEERDRVMRALPLPPKGTALSMGESVHRYTATHEVETRPDGEVAQVYRLEWP